MFPIPHSIDPSQAEPSHPLPQTGFTSIIDGPHQACELRKQTRQKQGIGAEGGGQAAWLRRAWQVPTSSGLLTICTAHPARARLEGPLGTPSTPKEGCTWDHTGLASWGPGVSHRSPGHAEHKAQGCLWAAVQLASPRPPSPTGFHGPRGREGVSRAIMP